MFRKNVTVSSAWRWRHWVPPKLWYLLASLQDVTIQTSLSVRVMGRCHTNASIQSTERRTFCGYTTARFVACFCGIGEWRRLWSEEGRKKANKRSRRTQGPTESKWASLTDTACPDINISFPYLVAVIEQFEVSSWPLRATALRPYIYRNVPALGTGQTVHIQLFERCGVTEGLPNSFAPPLS